METMDVAVLKLGIDAAARAEVQRKMNEIASSGDTNSPSGLVQMLREAVALLRGVERAWTHGAVENASPMPRAEAQARFLEAASDARSRFDHEVIRATDGDVQSQPAPDLPESDEPSMVVITIVVAARRALRDVGDIDRESFALALDDLASVSPEDFVAMEVIWSPADENDRPSVSEVEGNYPELVRFSEEVA